MSEPKPAPLTRKKNPKRQKNEEKQGEGLVKDPPIEEMTVD